MFQIKLVSGGGSKALQTREYTLSFTNIEEARQWGAMQAEALGMVDDLVVQVKEVEAEVSMAV